MDTVSTGAEHAVDPRTTVPMPEAHQTIAQAGTHQDDRRHNRFRTLKRGRILYNLGRSSLDVQITNQSECGAKIRLRTLWIAPAIFELQVFNPNSDTWQSFKCARVWHKGYEMGVHRISAPAPYVSPRDPNI